MASITELTARLGPHIHSGESINTVSKDLIIALAPIFITSVYIFGFPAVIMIFVCTAGAVLGEIAARRYKGEEPNLADGTAVITGLLLALTLPPTAWWAMVPLYGLGGFLSIAIFREAMGGLGRNRFNPALMSRVLLLFGRTALVYMAPLIMSWFPAMEPYLVELEVVDTTTTATPLLMLSEGMNLPAYSDFFLIYEGGAPAETSIIAILLGMVYLLYRKRIEWEIPAVIVAGIFIIAFLAGEDPVFHVLSGGMLFGAVYMATDWVTRPVTFTGRIIFGIGIGAIIVFFRVIVGDLWVPVGGVAFAILIMNGFVPTIERLTVKKKFGAFSKGG